MTSDVSSKPAKAFDKANELWFFEGRTHEAARLYEEAARGAPDDMAIQFQWARAQWALGRAEAARATLDHALLQAKRTGGAAHHQLQELQQQLASERGELLPGGLGLHDVDVERLAERRLSAAQWSAIARAAERLGMYGVALFARRRAKGPITDIDEEKEDWALIKKAESELTRLDLLRSPKA